MPTHSWNYAAGLDHIELWIEPKTVARYEAFGRVLELLDQG